MKTHKKQVKRLKDILGIPTFFKQEHELLRYIIKFLRTTPYDFTVDAFGNLYITKGSAEYYPLVCAHTDSVQKRIQIKIQQVTFDGKECFIGKRLSEPLIQCGIGADDKAGVFVCLELLDILPELKVVLFASEEYGCVGSQNVNPVFFENVGYVMEFDCPGNSDITHYCNGIQLFDKEGEFFGKIQPILESKMPHPIKLHRHPYTDVWCVKRMFDMSCINIATGYYRYHEQNEFVVIDEVLNAVTIGEEIIRSLGNVKYYFLSPLTEITKYDTVIGAFKREFPDLFPENNDYLKLLTETE